MNVTGILLGLATFLSIGLFHPIVIKAEYYFGVRCWWAFLLSGIGFLAASLFVQNNSFSILLGVEAFSCFWSILEVFQQRERVRKGWFPMNPKRKADYER
ncbi:MAG: DUF4491 family protein [Bacteroidaceae bacterium]|nr:DUF4491 family protein [Prevotellaceae bacterium]MDY5632200.1 DUF4491 family protein [Bacteroidaceae bacterium]